MSLQIVELEVVFPDPIIASVVVAQVGPQGVQGAQGPIGLTGVVAATAPLVYDAETRTLSITGVVLTGGTYADPAWIISLAWSKIAGAPAFITAAALTPYAPLVSPSLTTPDIGAATATSITGTGALTIAAGGTNQNITLAPSGTGKVVSLSILHVADGSSAAPAFSFTNEPTLGFWRNGPTWMIARAATFDFAGGAMMRFLSDNSSIRFGTSGDTIILRDAANTLAQRNGTSAQTFNIYGTYGGTGGADFERIRIGYASNVAYLGLQHGGTGTGREFRIHGFSDGNAAIKFTTGGHVAFGPGNTTTTWWRFDVNGGHFLTATDNTYDIGASGATRPRNVYVGTDIVAGGSLTLGGGILATGSITAGNGGLIRWNSGSYMSSPGNGVIRLTDNAQATFDRLQFGGTTSAFPALKRSTTVLQARLADDSTFTFLQGKLRTEANAVAEAITPTHTVTLYDAAGTAYKVPCVAA